MLPLLTRRLSQAALLAFCCWAALAQVPERMVGVVSSVTLDQATFDVKAQDGKVVTIHLTSETILQRIAPGEKNLKNAETIQATDIAVGDKVLVNSDVASSSARRVVVMSATAIVKHDEADQAAWNTHGISGIVVTKVGNDLTLRIRNLQGESQAHVLVSADTHFRKYAADSVKYGDAKVSSLAEVQAGDQLRARGDKSEDGLKVTASEIVFGTFVTKAGTVTAIDEEHKSVAVKELNTNVAFNVKLTADSQLKQMPDFGGMGGGPPGAAGGAPPMAANGPPANGDRTAPGAGGGMRPMPMGSGGKPLDIAQMIEHMPSVSLSALKVGDTVVMSSTKGAVPNEYTAIILLDNATMLVRMATAQKSGQAGGAPGRGAPGGAAGGQGGMQGMGGGGLGNLELPGMLQ